MEEFVGWGDLNEGIHRRSNVVGFFRDAAGEVTWLPRETIARVAASEDRTGPYSTAITSSLRCDRRGQPRPQVESLEPAA